MVSIRVLVPIGINQRQYNWYFVVFPLSTHLAKTDRLGIRIMCLLADCCLCELSL